VEVVVTAALEEIVEEIVEVIGIVEVTVEVIAEVIVVIVEAIVVTVTGALNVTKAVISHGIVEKLTGATNVIKLVILRETVRSHAGMKVETVVENLIRLATTVTKRATSLVIVLNLTREIHKHATHVERQVI